MSRIVGRHTVSGLLVVVCVAIVALAIVFAPARAYASEWEAVFYEGDIWSGNIIGSGVDLTWEDGTENLNSDLLFTDVLPDYDKYKLVSFQFAGHQTTWYAHNGTQESWDVTRANLSRIHLYDSYGSEVSSSIAPFLLLAGKPKDGFSIVCNNLDPDEQYTLVIGAGIEDQMSHDKSTNSFSFTFTVSGLRDKGENPGSNDGNGSGDGNGGGDGSGSDGHGGQGGTADGGGAGDGSQSGNAGSAGGQDIGDAASAAMSGSSDNSIQSVVMTRDATSRADIPVGDATLHKITNASLSTSSASDQASQAGGSASGGGSNDGQSETGYLWMLILIAVAALVYGMVRTHGAYLFNLRGALALDSRSGTLGGLAPGTSLRGLGGRRGSFRMR